MGVCRSCHMILDGRMARLHRRPVLRRPTK
jgi:hypothetical protein